MYLFRVCCLCFELLSSLPLLHSHSEVNPNIYYDSNVAFVLLTFLTIACIVYGKHHFWKSLPWEAGNAFQWGRRVTSEQSTDCLWTSGRGWSLSATKQKRKVWLQREKQGGEKARGSKSGFHMRWEWKNFWWPAVKVMLSHHGKFSSDTCLLREQRMRDFQEVPKEALWGGRRG